ncbi:hypothetical protein L2E82_38997 [Cichorium intybus]|uniref:Uncharacterized protein n=1 Tax=Cichorium intybus TaxID=13427 RepID=A0ACB9AHR9_CICIN|nr:hypothetical protein L2E82_38997 [Cichorium intybus]
MSMVCTLPLRNVYGLPATNSIPHVFNKLQVLEPKSLGKLHRPKVCLLTPFYLLDFQLLTKGPFCQLPDFLAGSCACRVEGGCLGSNVGPWNDPEIMQEEAGYSMHGIA